MVTLPMGLLNRVLFAHNRNNGILSLFVFCLVEKYHDS